MFIDEGKPTEQAFEATLANLREVAYFNVPKGYEMLAAASVAGDFEKIVIRDEVRPLILKENAIQFFGA